MFQAPCCRMWMCGKLLVLRLISYAQQEVDCCQRVQTNFFPQTIWGQCDQGHGQYTSVEYPIIWKLKTYATALSWGVSFSTQNAWNTVCQLVCSWTCWGAHSAPPDSLLGSSWYWYFFFPSFSREKSKCRVWLVVTYISFVDINSGSFTCLMSLLLLNQRNVKAVNLHQSHNNNMCVVKPIFNSLPLHVLWWRLRTGENKPHTGPL